MSALVRTRPDAPEDAGIRLEVGRLYWFDGCSVAEHKTFSETNMHSVKHTTYVLVK